MNMYLSLHDLLLLIEVLPSPISPVVVAKLLQPFDSLWPFVIVWLLFPFVMPYMLLDMFVCLRVPVASIAIQYDHIRCVPMHLYKKEGK